MAPTMSESRELPEPRARRSREEGASPRVCFGSGERALAADGRDWQLIVVARLQCASDVAKFLAPPPLLLIENVKMILGCIQQRPTLNVSLIERPIYPEQQ